MIVASARERPDLAERGRATSAVWPEYNVHSPISNRYWDRLIPEFPDCQFVLYDEAADDVLAQGHSAPLVWDGTPEGLLRAMRDIAAAQGLGDLIAPVRPSLKERYPLVPIEAYAAWRREDGLPFDPWMRVHARLGGTILRTEPQSLMIPGTVAEWEAWTGMAFPATGDYWFPRGLATVRIDRGADTGVYWEPNVWMRHPARP